MRSTCLLFIVASLAAAMPAFGDYTDYYMEQPNRPPAFYNYDMYVTWESAPATSRIYPAFNFSFQAGVGGYMGLQLVGNTKKVLFSIWDVSGNANTALPTGNCNRFGGEGTGTQCLMNYDWVLGREYRLRIWILGAVPGGETWVGAIYDTETGIETQIGVIELRDTNGYSGYGWLTDHTSVFLEYFGSDNGCSTRPYSRIKWRGPWADAGTWLASRALIPYWVNYPCPDHNDVTSTVKPLVWHEAGGSGTPITNPIGTVLWPGCGDGEVTAGEECDDGNTVAGDCCSASCTFETAGTSCAASNLCFTGTCTGSGTCESVPRPPRPECRQSTAPRAGRLRLSNRSDTSKNRLDWTWGKGVATAKAAFGSPDSTTEYAFCVYDGTDQLIMSADIPAGTLWNETSSGFRYKDRASTADGVSSIVLTQGLQDGKAKIALGGKGTELDMPMLPIAPGALPLRAQLEAGNGECWVATYGAFISRNSAEGFSAKSD